MGVKLKKIHDSANLPKSIEESQGNGFTGDQCDECGQMTVHIAVIEGTPHRFLNCAWCENRISLPDKAA